MHVPLDVVGGVNFTRVQSSNAFHKNKLHQGRQVSHLNPSTISISSLLHTVMTDYMHSAATHATIGLPDKRASFPTKLYEMLESVGLLGLSDSVTWLSHGRAFAVLNNEKFMDYVVPMFFKQTKIRSFTRQLNLWGFKRYVFLRIDFICWLLR